MPISMPAAPFLIGISTKIIPISKKSLLISLLANN